MPTDRREAGPHPLGALMAGCTVAGLTDVELLGRFLRAGRPESEAAFGALASLHGPMVLRVCLSVLGNHHDAQDAFQATFLILARRAGSIRKARSLAPWLHGVALRVSRAALAAADRRRSHERRSAALAPARQVVQEDREAIALVHEELGRLPDRYRVPLILCELEGLTHDGAADRLGWPVGTVKSRLARGRQRLRAGLERRGLSPEAVPLAIVVATGDRISIAGPLAAATSRIVSALASGSPSWANPSARVASLTKEVLLVMSLPRICALACLPLAAGLVGGGAFLTASSGPPAILPIAAQVRQMSLVADTPTPGEDPGGELPSVLTTPRPWETAAKMEVRSGDASKPWTAYGSGTIVRSDDGGSLLVTAAHIFRDGAPPADVRPEGFSRPIRVGLFEGTFSGKDRSGLRPAGTYDGELVGIDHAADVALVRIRPGRRLPASPVALGTEVGVGQPLVSVGCSNGHDATVWSTTVTRTKTRIRNEVLDLDFIECRHAPKEGRSGGGLFNLDGELVGVTCYADPNGDRGLYSPAAPIRGLLERIDTGDASPPAGADGWPNEGRRAGSPRAASATPDAAGEAGLSRRLGEVEKKLDLILEALKDR